MAQLQRYRTFVSDNARWEGFPYRADDIVISTAPKCGTTWMQTLCAMVVLDTVELPEPLSEISPWLDMQTNNPAVIRARLEAQEHRRIIKTHTPMDGLPFDERVTYICVGRDPRDVSLSWDHHLANMDMANLVTARANAVGLDDVEEFGPIPEPPADPVERFWQWTEDWPGATVSVRLPAILHHLRTFWDIRDQPSIALFHYADLLADLPGEVRRLAGVLGIAVTDERVAAIADAATFDRMKQQPDRFVPDLANNIWHSNTDFFHRGVSGQWRELLDDAGLRRYDARVAELVPPDLAAWAHTGWRG